MQNPDKRRRAIRGAMREAENALKYAQRNEANKEAMDRETIALLALGLSRAVSSLIAEMIREDDDSEE